MTKGNETEGNATGAANATEAISNETAANVTAVEGESNISANASGRLLQEDGLGAGKPAKNVSANATASGAAANVSAGGAAANVSAGNASADAAAGTNVSERRNETNATEGNASAASNVSANASFIKNFSIVWLADFDRENVTVEDIVQNLTAQGVYLNFEKWFNFFFGSNGLIVKNFTQANATNATAGNETVTNATAEGNMTNATGAANETAINAETNVSANSSGRRRLQQASMSLISGQT